MLPKSVPLSGLSCVSSFSAISSSFIRFFGNIFRYVRDKMRAVSSAEDRSMRVVVSRGRTAPQAESLLRNGRCLWAGGCCMTEAVSVGRRHGARRRSVREFAGGKGGQNLCGRSRAGKMAAGEKCFGRGRSRKSGGKLGYIGVCDNLSGHITAAGSLLGGRLPAGIVRRYVFLLGTYRPSGPSAMRAAIRAYPFSFGWRPSRNSVSSIEPFLSSRR